MSDLRQHLLGREGRSRANPGGADLETGFGVGTSANRSSHAGGSSSSSGLAQPMWRQGPQAASGLGVAPTSKNRGGQTELSAGGRRVFGGIGSARRVSSPIRTTAEARRKLQESLNADGEAKAICLGATLDLERVAESINPRPSNTRPPAEAAGSREQDITGSPLQTAAGRRPPAVPGAFGVDGTEVAKKFGIGENLVIQLKLFNDKDLFAFRYGCIVCWNFTATEYHSIKERMKPFMIRLLPDADFEEEVMEFIIRHRIDEGTAEDAEEKSDDEDAASADDAVIKHDQIVLSTSDPMERLAHSYALAQSVRLAVFEIVVDRSIVKTRIIPETMANTGDVALDARELSKQMGGLLMLRCDVNLHTDILDTPDIFWDEEKFEPHYVESREYLEVDKRVEILNQRLSVLKDMYDLLQNGLNVKHGNKLEWIIIILILVEVVLELCELLHDAWRK
eukprot:TRINITY_DN56736_c0_g1_i1.p1 TRINITY_DN56736_c0_g1~~TRINITY_DN56736_c0_g1_i1.p1  ORF type:complete len:452 (+),score=83.54 TRINITY_DN56736_c0_g1_i1:121-1476(+)